jgi:hypothetical protein
VFVAQLVYDSTLFLVIAASTFFLMPLSILLVIQTKNFRAGKTTQSRLKAINISSLGVKIE